MRNKKKIVIIHFSKVSGPLFITSDEQKWPGMRFFHMHTRILTHTYIHRHTHTRARARNFLWKFNSKKKKITYAKISRTLCDERGYDYAHKPKVLKRFDFWKIQIEYVFETACTWLCSKTRFWTKIYYYCCKAVGFASNRTRIKNAIYQSSCTSLKTKSKLTCDPADMGLKTFSFYSLTLTGNPFGITGNGRHCVPVVRDR